MSYTKKFSSVPQTEDCRLRFVIAVEGDVTETKYFRKVFKERLDSICAEILILPPHSESDAHSVCEKLLKKRGEDSENSRKNTRYWMVVDCDQTSEKVFNDIEKKCTQSHCSLCVSNPSFEFWLLLHFEEGAGISPAENLPDSPNLSVQECQNRLRSKKYLQMNGKHLSDKECDTLFKKVDTAIRNAKKLHTNKRSAVLSRQTGSTVYLLAQELKKHIH